MNSKLIHKLLLFSFLILATWSCERDDICAAVTETTPHLIILFNDISNPDESKQVRRLTVLSEGFDTPIVYRTSTDSIVLPLRLQSTNSTSTRFILTKNADYEDDDMNPDTNPNSDIIEVLYTPELVYVSRACGYKSIFTNVSVNIQSDNDNWILSSEIINTNIENETQAHLILRH